MTVDYKANNVKKQLMAVYIVQWTEITCQKRGKTKTSWHDQLLVYWKV